MKLQNPVGSHDDIVVSVGMVLVDLLDVPDVGHGSITVPDGRIIRTTKDEEPVMPTRLAVLDAQRRGPRGVKAIPGVRGDYYSRRTRQ